MAVLKISAAKPCFIWQGSHRERPRLKILFMILKAMLRARFYCLNGAGIRGAGGLFMRAQWAYTEIPRDSLLAKNIRTGLRRFTARQNPQQRPILSSIRDWASIPPYSGFLTYTAPARIWPTG